MGRWNRHNLDNFIYYLLRVALLTAAVAAGNYLFGLTPNSDSLFTIIYLSLIIQFGLLIRLPSNDIFPVKNRLLDFKEHFKDESRFPLIISTVVFFLGMELKPLSLAAILVTNLVFQTGLFFFCRKYCLKSRKYKNRSSESDTKNILIVGAGPRGQRAVEHLLEHPELDIRVIGFVDAHRKGLWRYRDIPLIGHPENVASIISRNHIDYVVIANEPSDFVLSQNIFKTVEQMGIKICVLPDIFERDISRCCPFSLNGQPVLLYHTVPENRAALLVKRVMDRVGSVMGILLVAPIMTLAAIAIKFDSPGAVIYHQKRIGRNGRVFDMLKFRTMTNGAEKLKEQLRHLNEMSGPVFKIRNDPRVTRVGKFLRKYSIDELPQLFNVLKGDMSLVGPRPPLPKEVEQYAPWQHRRLSVKPGVTCLWQVNGRNKIDFNEWMKLDLQYIDRWSLKEDMRILAKTVPTVLKGSGS